MHAKVHGRAARKQAYPTLAALLVQPLPTGNDPQRIGLAPGFRVVVAAPQHGVGIGIAAQHGAGRVLLQARGAEQPAPVAGGALPGQSLWTVLSTKPKAAPGPGGQRG